MKQEPICPSLKQKTILSSFPKRTLVFSEHVNSVGIELACTVAVLFNIIVFLLMFFCLHVKKEVFPLSSMVVVQFQEGMKSLSSLDAIAENKTDDLKAVTIPVARSPVNALPAMNALQKISVPTIQDQSSNRNISKNKMAAQSAMGQQKRQDRGMEQKAKSSIPLVSHNFPLQRCSSPESTYPLAARRRHEQGVAKVALQILSNGQVGQVKIVETSGFVDLDQAAIEAVQQIKCSALKDNDTLVQTTTTVHFELRHN